MREIRQSGSEGGGGESNRLSLPLLHLNTCESSTLSAACSSFSILLRVEYRYW